MYGFGTAQIIGNLTKDPEVRYTPQGKASTLFSLAINRTRTNKATGEKREETTYVDIRAWEKIAEICKDAKKGEAMFVSGEIREERWEKDGQKRSKLRIVAFDVRRIPKFPPRDPDFGKTGEKTAPAPVGSQVQKVPAKNPPPPPAQVTEDDFEPGDDSAIPF